MTEDLVAAACLVWYIFILLVCAIGIFQMYSSRNAAILHNADAPTVGRITLESLPGQSPAICPSPQSLMSRLFAPSKALSLECTIAWPPPSSKIITAPN